MTLLFVTQYLVAIYTYIKNKQSNNKGSKKQKEQMQQQHFHRHHFIILISLKVSLQDSNTYSSYKTFIISVTNRVDMVNMALLRPRRFDKFYLYLTDQNYDIKEDGSINSTVVVLFLTSLSA